MRNLAVFPKVRKDKKQAPDVILPVCFMPAYDRTNKNYKK